MIVCKLPVTALTQMQIERTASASPYEKSIGFCRAIRVGQQIHLAGTAAFDEAGQVVAAGDAYQQACRCLEIAAKALTELGADLAQTYRVRWFLTDIQQQDAVAKAHQQHFAAHPPVATMLGVQALVDPGLCVELELEAWID